MLFMYKYKRECTNDALRILIVCAQNSKIEVLSFHHGPPWMLLIYKQKRKCTKEKNMCTNDALTILRVWTQNSKMGLW